MNRGFKKIRVDGSILPMTYMRPLCDDLARGSCMKCLSLCPGLSKVTQALRGKELALTPLGIVTLSRPQVDSYLAAHSDFSQLAHPYLYPLSSYLGL